MTMVASNGHGEVFFFGTAGDLVLTDDVIGDLPFDGMIVGFGLGNGELTPPVSDVAEGVAADIGVILCVYDMLPTGLAGVAVMISASTTNVFTPGDDADADANCFVITAAVDSADSTSIAFSLLCNALKISSALTVLRGGGGGGGGGDDDGGGLVGGGKGTPPALMIGGGEDGGGGILLLFVDEPNLSSNVSSPASINDGVRVEVL